MEMFLLLPQAAFVSFEESTGTAMGYSKRLHPFSKRRIGSVRLLAYASESDIFRSIPHYSVDAMEKEKEEELVKKIAEGKLKSHEVAAVVRDENEATRIRRMYVERRTGVELSAVGSGAIDFKDACARNIENSIGSAQIPVGFVELLIDGDFMSGNSAVFFATTEGKLVAGLNRGASAINRSGGVKVRHLSSNMTRSVILDTGSVEGSLKATEFVKSEAGLALLKKAFRDKSSRIELLDVEAYTTGRLLYIRYSADTKAAMGMNMVTIASSHATKILADELEKMGVRADVMSESGNMCADKKPSTINTIRGRGVSLAAEATIKPDVLKKYFGIEAKSVERLNYMKNYVGSGLAGSFAHNAHVANVLAATFIAYGQDVAQIVDAVNAFDDVKAEEDGSLYISLYMPDLEVGTYGGGTHRETAKELLRASGVYGEGDNDGKTKVMLAELIAAAALAGELNLLCAESAGVLAESHSKLMR